MPELPEVETVARELRKLIIDKQIEGIETAWNRSFDNRCAIEVAKQKINSVQRKGKYLIIELTRSFLIVHLRMTGQLLYKSAGQTIDSIDHIRVIIKFKQGMLLFKDVRKFGRIYHVSNAVAFLDHIGTDALDTAVTKEHFYKLLKPSRMNIKAFLLSQKYISGMGNIYTDEALFLSAVHPAMISGNLSKKQADLLHDNMLSVLNNSIQNMGSTISDYRDPEGKKGLNQLYFNVYGREGLLCKTCSTPVAKIRLAGRGTHFCPQCQKV